MRISAAVLSLLVATGAAAAERLAPEDVFGLEYAADPRISPDGRRVVYVRTFMDVMTDRRRSNLWLVEVAGSGHQPLTSGTANHSSPRWSPEGDRLAWVSTAEGSAQIHVRWMETGAAARVTQLTRRPRGLAWSPDGRWLAFSMPVPYRPEPLVEPPVKPKGADWGEPARVIDRMEYRADGAGWLPHAYSHVFVVPADGGTPRQLTDGDYHHRGRLSWTPDGAAIVFAANRRDDWEYDPLNSEVYAVSVADRRITALTDRQGPDRAPAVSPDGKRIAYVGFDDRVQGYQVVSLYVMDRDGSGARPLVPELDRDVQGPVWSAGGQGVFFQYDDRGDTKLAYASLDGELETLFGDLGGLSLGRPYGDASFSAARDGTVAYTFSRPDRPADVAVAHRGSQPRRLTDLNEDLLGHRELAEIEEIWFESSHDGRRVQGWIAKPPGFDPSRRYPLILEIHGGPFANYGPRFSAEVQLYAAAGYAVLYTNPRGSTSYGEEFGNLIHHAYPGHDYDDLMSGVDALLARGWVDSDRLYVTGGSGGGVLSAWIVGKTDRFAAAAVQKPVINWSSFVLHADMPGFFSKYWFPGFPWEEPEHYHRRSPLSLVGDVSTPTMLITGEEDWRTPMSETEQYYTALRLRKVPSLMVRISEAPHGIANRPSHLIAKVSHILAWFDRHHGGD